MGMAKVVWDFHNAGCLSDSAPPIEPFNGREVSTCDGLDSLLHLLKSPLFLAILVAYIGCDVTSHYALHVEVHINMNVNSPLHPESTVTINRTHTNPTINLFFKFSPHCHQFPHVLPLDSTMHLHTRGSLQWPIKVPNHMSLACGRRMKPPDGNKHMITVRMFKPRTDDI